MIVTCYNVGKAKNSTWIPTSGGQDYEGTLRVPSSILKPTITFQFGKDWCPKNINYCYIPEFRRYYFVNDWEYSTGLWVCYLEVDVMASFKSEIGKKSYYIIRTSTAFDGRISDALYPSFSNPTRNATVASHPLFPQANSVKSGTFVVGIIGKNGMCEYYKFNYAGFVKFSESVFSSMTWMQSNDLADLGEDIAKMVFNPAQYITSVLWFPYDIVEDEVVIESKIGLGWWEVNATAVRLSSNAIDRVSTTVNVPSHPQAGTRGSYLNSYPYRRGRLFIQGFGSIELNYSKIIENTLTIQCDIDCRTGGAVAYVYIVKGNEKYMLANVPGKVGFSISIGDIKNDLPGAIGSAVGAVGSIVSGNWIGSASSLLNLGLQLTNAEATALSSADTVASMLVNTQLITDCYEITEEDNADNGRPYMKNGVPSSMGNGFYIVENGNVNIIGAYADEITMIKNYLEGGFYYA